MTRLFSVYFFICGLAFSATPPDYRQWISACAKLPSNRELNGKRPDPKLLPLPEFSDFDAALDGFLASVRNGEISERGKWVNGAPDSAVFFDTSRSWFGGEDIPFQPYAAKLVLQDDATTILIGDLHGDIRSFLHMLEELNHRKILDGFRIRRPNVRLLFTGDFTDRGAYGVEVLYTLFRLKASSPAQVHIGRGNHEDFGLNSRYGFLEEIRGKYGMDANITKLMRAYDLLPVVVYLGNGRDFLQINHGGMEPGFDPRSLLASSGDNRFQLLGELKQKTYDEDRPGWLGDDPDVRDLVAENFRNFIPETPTKPNAIGFMWNDFSVFADEPQLGAGRPLVYGPVPTRRILADASTGTIRLRGVIRAHQHASPLNPLMSRLVACEGVFRHWQTTEDSSHANDSVDEIRKALKQEVPQPLPDGSVWTLNVSPDSIYGTGCGYDFASAAIVRFAPEFKDWRISSIAVDVKFEQ